MKVIDCKAHSIPTNLMTLPAAVFFTVLESQIATVLMAVGLLYKVLGT